MSRFRSDADFAALLLLGFLSLSVFGPASSSAQEPGTRVHLATHVFDPLEGEPTVSPQLTLQPTAGRENPWIVQLNGPIDEIHKQALADLEADIQGYVPEFSFVVRATPAVAEQMRRLEFVRWVGPYHPAYRISPEIGTQEFQHPDRQDPTTRTLIVRVFDDPASAADRFRASGAEIVELIEDGFQKLIVLELPSSQIETIAADPQCWWIEEKPESFLLNNTTRWVVQSNASGQTPIWDLGLTGEGQIVAVMDSGLDYNSCWFRETGNAPPGPSHRKVIDYTTWGGNAYDGCGTGHGTHVCGTLAGDRSYIDPGNLSSNGLAYGAKLALQDIGQDGFFDCLLGFVSVPNSLVAAFDDAYALGARIHSNSWGSTSNSYATHSANVDQFMWDHPDFLVVFANGNSGPGGSTVGAPATAKSCISVGSTQQAPNQNTIAGYSSRGPAFDTRYKPTVVAPGGDSNGYIVSADNNSGNPPSATCQTVGSPFAGTSMATPVIAGLAALTRQYFEEGFYPSGAGDVADALSPSAALLKAVLVNAATDAGAANIPNNNEGWGRLLLDDGLYFDGDARELRVEEDAGVATGQSRSYVYNVDSSDEPLEVVLVWTDYPATTGVGVAIVNDLDLVVTGPGGGTVYNGNQFSGGQSTVGGSNDRRNVEEVVRIDSPAVGDYTIEVHGFNVPQGGSQPFALASTGSFGSWPADPASTPDAIAEAAPAWSMVSVEPNPTSAGATIRFVARQQAEAELAIYDLAGRRVCNLGRAAFDAGRHQVIWDGRADDGSELAAGVYFFQLQSGDMTIEQKITRLE